MHLDVAEGCPGELSGRQKLPTPAAVGRFEQSQPRVRICRCDTLTGPCENDSWIAGGKSDSPHRQRRLIVRTGYPGHSCVPRLPNSTLRSANQPVIGIGRVDRDAGDAATDGRWRSRRPIEDWGRTNTYPVVALKPGRIAAR